ncbi:HPP family protein [Halocalculus aciditolerans]|uniref:HPP family protein n=1 Tax=Halocalculus aciditolerans TaxID=1383812 RepID=A0A830F905_9EURY|nr:HPP family protein [Halocalculus aciditolerans]GGL51720.1 hypothetical protein GCM10009039_07540 [Halocalculus aciditolerans]
MAWTDRLDAALGVYLAGLLAPVTLLAWATGFPFILPSLGPSAYVLATSEGRERETVVGQAVGVVAAYVCVRALVGPLASVGFVPHTLGGLAQVAAILVAVVLATLGMAAADSRHAPAYATVLIFTLGIPSRGVDVLVFLAGVAFLVAAHAALDSVGLRP